MPDQPRKSSFSKKGKNPSASDPILSLGRKLVAALKSDDDDLLSQWMAHYIAELIADCDTTDAARSKAAKERCASAILDLWGHRASLTGVSKPFQELAPIIETLRTLDPEGEHLLYRRMMPNTGRAPNEETTKWLNFAKNCDAIARMLIGIGINKASEHAGGNASEWAGAASDAGLGLDLDVQISDFLDNRLSDMVRANERRTRQLRGRLEKLESFSAMVSALRTDMEKQIEDLEITDHC
jgi:hypothetical protein